MQSEVFKQACWSSVLFSFFLSLVVVGCGGNPGRTSSALPTPTPAASPAPIPLASPTPTPAASPTPTPVASPTPNQPTTQFNSADEFTIVALPDTQYYSRDFPDIF